MKKLKVLIACERSQIEQAAFAAVGCDSWSLDILPAYGSNPEKHILADAYKFALTGWDLIVAHPPCTELTHANNARRNAPGRITPVMRALRLWFRFLFQSPCPVCVENPVGIPSELLPPSQIVCPSMFGDPFRKRTCLWLRGLPPLVATCKVENAVNWVVCGRKKGASESCPRALRSTMRSQGFPGLAAAMASQWVPFLQGGVA